MMNNQQILMVGCGKMGGAILEGWLQSGIAPEQIHVIEKNPDIIASLAEKNIRSYDAVSELSVAPTVMMFAIKPQILASMIDEYRDYAANALCLSIIAGKPVAFFAKYLGEKTAIIRTMPNLPSLIQQGVTAAYANEAVTDQQKEIAAELLSVIGTFLWLEEETLMDAVTGVSGSGPAYVFLFIEYLINAGINAGLEKELARELAIHTVYGSAALAASSELTVETLRKNVTSPNGTTQAGLDALMQDKTMEKLVGNAVNAAKIRAKELAE